MSKAVKNKEVLTHVYVVEGYRVRKYQVEYRASDGALCEKGRSWYTYTLGKDAFKTKEAAQKALRKKIELKIRWIRRDIGNVLHRLETQKRRAEKELQRLNRDIVFLEKKLNG